MIKYPEGFNPYLKKETERIISRYIGREKMIYEQINMIFYWYERNNETTYFDNPDFLYQRDYFLASLKKRAETVKSLKKNKKTRIKLFIVEMENHGEAPPNTLQFMEEDYENS